MSQTDGFFQFVDLADQRFQFFLIAAAVDAGLLGYNMYRNEQQFYSGEGIVGKGVEPTIENVGKLGRLGMRETDREIIRIMTAPVQGGRTCCD